MFRAWLQSDTMSSARRSSSASSAARSFCESDLDTVKSFDELMRDPHEVTGLPVRIFCLPNPLPTRFPELCLLCLDLCLCALLESRAACKEYVILYRCSDMACLSLSCYACSCLWLACSCLSITITVYF